MRPSCVLPACPGASRTSNLQAQLVPVIVQRGFAHVSVWQLSTCSSTRAGDLSLPITGSSSAEGCEEDQPVPVSDDEEHSEGPGSLSNVGPGVLAVADSLPGWGLSLPFLP